MSKKIRVAFLGFWHSHACANEALQFAGPGAYGVVMQNPDIEAVVGWDDNEDRGREGAGVLGIVYEKDLEKVLSREDITGVVIMCETTRHREICIKAAEHGKHIYVNKVLAPTYKEACEIVAAVKENHIVMMTMLSRLYENWCVKIKEVIDSGKLGKLVAVRIWHSHGIASMYYPQDGMGYLYENHEFLNRKDGAGGCYIDMCHPQYMADYFMDGVPEKIYSRMSSVTRRGDVEDNAIALLEYKDGPYVTLEEGWACGPVTTEVEVYGTDGQLIYRDDRSDSRYACLAVRFGENPKFETIPFEPAKYTALEEWIERMEKGEPSEDNMKRAVELSLMNEAAYQSAATGQSVRLDSIAE